MPRTIITLDALTGSYVNVVDDVVVNGINVSVSGTLSVTGSTYLKNTEVDGYLIANSGLSGSLTKLADGTSYLIAGSNVQITSASNGAVTISSTASGGDTTASYVVLSSAESLSNERVLTVGSGLSMTDGGAGNNVTIFLTGSQYGLPYYSSSGEYASISAPSDGSRTGKVLGWIDNTTIGWVSVALAISTVSYSYDAIVVQSFNPLMVQEISGDTIL